MSPTHSVLGYLQVQDSIRPGVLWTGERSQGISPISNGVQSVCPAPVPVGTDGKGPSPLSLVPVSDGPGLQGTYRVGKTMGPGRCWSRPRSYGRTLEVIRSRQPRGPIDIRGPCVVREPCKNTEYVSTEVVTYVVPPLLVRL